MSDVEKMALTEDELRLCREAWNAAQTTQSGDRFAPDVLRLVMLVNRLHAALSAARPDEWQPIETAPIDCSDILLAHCWNRLTRVEICAAESGPAAFITPQADIPRGSDRLLGWMRLPDTSALRRPAGEEG